MGRKINVAILFGGKSVEHEISVKSSRNVADAIDKEKYDVTMIGITKDGQWVLEPKISEDGVVSGDNYLAVVPGASNAQIIDLKGRAVSDKLDVIFPILHGPYGEDGTMQGLIKLINLPFAGASVLSSAVGMDKEVMKRLLRDHNIPSAAYLVFNKFEGVTKNPTFDEVKKDLGLPAFVKPANLGSSVGISKINTREEFEKAISFGFMYDTKLIVESFVKGREIECAVLGNEAPMASLPGEVVSHHEFYSYEAKYLDENGAALAIPAILSEGMIEDVREMAIKTYQSLYCEGLTRVDFFITEDDQLLINEVNTMPGFTEISMYPKLWEATGIPYGELIDRLIELGIQRFKREIALKTSI